MVTVRLSPPTPPSFQLFRSKRAALIAREGFWRTVKCGLAEDGTHRVTPVIAYGDAGFASSAKGAAAAPTTGMRKSCVAVFGAYNVVAIDEYFTSAKHALKHDGTVCGKFLSDVIETRSGHAKRDAAKRAIHDHHPHSCVGSSNNTNARIPAKQFAVRGLKRCPRCSDFVDRDVNACKNMLQVRVGGKGARR